ADATPIEPAIVAAQPETGHLRQGSDRAAELSGPGYFCFQLPPSLYHHPASALATQRLANVRRMLSTHSGWPLRFAISAYKASQVLFCAFTSCRRLFRSLSGTRLRSRISIAPVSFTPIAPVSKNGFSCGKRFANEFSSAVFFGDGLSKSTAPCALASAITKLIDFLAAATSSGSARVTGATRYAPLSSVGSPRTLSIMRSAACSAAASGK